MKFEIQETIFKYPKALLESWKNGEKSWIPETLFVPNDVLTQQNFHFGEYYALKKYMELGWQGTAFYALGDWELNNPNYTKGRELVNQYVDPIRLSMLKALRKGKSKGEPDLMLYKEDGSLMFVEVKKQSDRVSTEQLVCLAQIKSILGCEVGITYLAEENRNYTAKTYELDVFDIPQQWLERN
ncbi:VRR-NUC domain-containing protein [Vibrio parahaemolyticus]|nr:VRR-NUC domain-containing protein [Vibrio parahaemolyticus]MDF4429875.1 VRR-NUC domain-containing protein [Vibrio parahaemolyticus]MDF4439050.1 VRR-NUC domain-containing protein [Vibrio parahaemolyticus]MDF4448355.1 VRR-NUC domain-containing protein [Vibrio parahaemolyticus]